MAAPERRWFTIDQAAEYLSLSRSSIKRLITDGTLRTHEVVGQRAVRIDRADLDALLRPRNPGE